MQGGLIKLYLYSTYEKFLLQLCVYLQTEVPSEQQQLHHLDSWDLRRYVVPKQTRSGTRLTKSEEDRIPTLTKDLFNVCTLQQQIIDMLNYRDTINHKYIIVTQ